MTEVLNLILHPLIVGLVVEIIITLCQCELLYWLHILLQRVTVHEQKTELNILLGKHRSFFVTGLNQAITINPVGAIQKGMPVVQEG